MNEQLQKEIFSRLDAIAAKLGVGTEHIWGILVKQAKLEGVSNLCVFVVVAIVAICLFVAAQRCRRRADVASKEEFSRDREDGYYHVSMIVYGLTAIASIISLCCLHDGLLLLLNPEFAALTKLLDALK